MFREKLSSRTFCDQGNGAVRHSTHKALGAVDYFKSESHYQHISVCFISFSLTSKAGGGYQTGQL